MACNDSKSTSTTTKGGLGGLGDLLGGAGTPAAPAASSLPQAVQDMLRATELGPTGYNDAMRVNVGIDTPPISAAGTSAMMGSAPSFTGYQPTPFKPDPLAPALPRDTTTPVSASTGATAAKPDPNAGWSPAGNVGGNDVFRLGGVYKTTKGGRTYVSNNGVSSWRPAPEFDSPRPANAGVNPQMKDPLGYSFGVDGTSRAPVPANIKSRG